MRDRYEISFPADMDDAGQTTAERQTEHMQNIDRGFL
jgi:hypothetical protein